MQCPVCKSFNIGVTGTRNEFRMFTQRYRVCEDCGTQWQSIEEIRPDTIQQNFAKQLFDSDEKLFEDFESNKCKKCKYVLKCETCKKK